MKRTRRGWSRRVRLSLLLRAGASSPETPEVRADHALEPPHSTEWEFIKTVNAAGGAVKRRTARLMHNGNSLAKRHNFARLYSIRRWIVASALSQ